MVVELTFKAGDGARLLCREGEGRTEYREAATGLRLRVTSKGARAWSIVYWSPLVRTTRRYRIGDGALMPLSQARARARSVLHAVEQEGRDPQAERVAAGAKEREARKVRAEARRLAAEDRRRRGVTFGKLCGEYVEERRTTASGRYNRPAAKNTLNSWRPMLNHYILPALGDRPPEDITSEHFHDVLRDATRRGGSSMGPRVRELLSAVWRWIEQRPVGLGVRLPAVSPLARLPKVGAANRERERALSPAEVWRLWRATEEEGQEGAALRFMLLTASRVKEATDIHVSELDLAAAVWRLPAARNKGGRDRVIPLSAQALELLRRAPSGSEYPFGAGYTRMWWLMDRVRARMGGAPWQARDLRRTAATRCAILGADPFVVAGVLGHATLDERIPAVTKTYLRHDYEDRVRAALTKLGAWVEETVSRTTEPGDVVSIEARR